MYCAITNVPYTDVTMKRADQVKNDLFAQCSVTGEEIV